MKGALLVSILVFALAPVSPEAASGLVTDAKRARLSGVRVTSFPWDETYTDDGGRFTLSQLGAFVRFSRDGYRPRTLRASVVARPVVLEPADEPPWSPEPCPSDRSVRLLEASGGFGFVVPDGVAIERTHSDHYTVATIEQHGVILQIGSGPHWSYSGVPRRLLEDSTSLSERDIKVPWDVSVGEYRGVLSDGTKWRSIGVFSETAEYSGASESAARDLDAIMDTLCLVRH